MSQMLIRNCRVEMNMKAASLIWDSLLQKITASRPKFYSSLVNRLLEELIKPCAVDPIADTRKSAILQWLVHLLSTKEWEATCDSQNDLKTQITETSLLSPTAWTHKLAKAIIDRADDDFRELWAPLHEASLFGGVMEETGLPDHSTVNDEVMQETETDMVADLEKGDGCEDAHITPRNTMSVPVTNLPNPKVSTAIPSTDHGWRLWEGGWVSKPIGS
jgi:hypothetical protein